MKKLFCMTGDAKLCNIIRSLLSSRMFHVTLNNKKSRWFHQTNGLPQGSVLAPLLFNVYNDQPLPDGCSRFLYADDLAMTTQQSTFPEVEATLEQGLAYMSAYYLQNHRHPNPGKTQFCSFNLKNREVKWELDIIWNKARKLSLATLDRTLWYREHIQKTRAKVSRNSLLRQLTNSKWGLTRVHYAHLHWPCAFLLQNMSGAWSRSCHSQKPDPMLSETCRIVTGWIKRTPVHYLYAPP